MNPSEQDIQQLVDIVEGLNEAKYNGYYITLDNEHEVVEKIAGNIKAHMIHPSLDEVEKRLRDKLQELAGSKYCQYYHPCKHPEFAGDCYKCDANSILSILKDYQPKEIKLPEFKVWDDNKFQQNSFEHGVACGWNSCLDACEKAVEESIK